MRPEEVPTRFDETTIRLVVATCKMNMDRFAGEHSHALAGTATMIIGQRLHWIEIGHHAITPQAQVELYGSALAQDAPAEAVEIFRSRFTPDVLESTCDEIRAFAVQQGVNVVELAAALNEVAAVMTYATSARRA